MSPNVSFLIFWLSIMTISISIGILIIMYQSGCLPCFNNSRNQSVFNPAQNINQFTCDDLEIDSVEDRRCWREANGITGVEMSPLTHVLH